MGEGQILAQVKQVFQVGQNCPGFGRHLTGLFKQAVTGGKRVRSETSIASGQSQCVRQCTRKPGKLSHRAGTELPWLWTPPDRPLQTGCHGGQARVR